MSPGSCVEMLIDRDGIAPHPHMSRKRVGSGGLEQKENMDTG